jgi:hypothetical protein
MSILPRICLLLVVLASGAAHAQTETRPQGAPNASKSEPTQTAAELPASAAQSFAQCLQSWDAETHMSRGEWSAACRRLSDERDKFLEKQAKQKKQP